MISYIGKRLTALILSLLLFSMMMFALIRLMPGSEADYYLASANASIEDYQQLKAKLEGQGNFLRQYSRWLINAFKGDFGYSTSYLDRTSVVVGKAFAASIKLMLPPLLLSVITAFCLAVFFMICQQKLLSRLMMTFNTLIIAIPLYIVALIAQQILAVNLGWAAISFVSGSFMLPFIIIFISSTAYLSRQYYQLLLESSGRLYALIPQQMPLWQYYGLWLMKPVWPPFLAITILQLNRIVTGSLLLETVFDYPGIGKTLYSAVLGRDYHLIMALTMLMVSISMVNNFIADFAFKKALRGA